MSYDSSLVEKRVKDFRVQIARVIRGPRVLQTLHAFIATAEGNDIKRQYDVSPEKATFRMIELLLKSDKPGKWRAFLEALEVTDYPYLVDLLKTDNQEPEDYRHQKNIIQIFSPYLELQLNPMDIVQSLCASNIINEADSQEIQACERNQGTTAATMVLLDKIQCRLSPTKWYVGFLKVLWENGHEDIVKQMEPEFTLECRVMKCPAILISAAKNTSQPSDIDQVIEGRIIKFRRFLIMFVRVDNIWPHVVADLIPNDVAQSIHRLCNEGNIIAMETLLDEIFKIELNFKWTRFVECLRKSDYPYMADILSCDEKNIQLREMNILKLFSPRLANRLNPIEMMTSLLAEGVINEHDTAEIISKCRTSGHVAASTILLDRIHCRLPPRQWFTSFLRVLIKCGHADIAREVDPDYCLKQRDNQTGSTFACFSTGCDTAEALDKLGKMNQDLESAFVNVNKFRLKREINALRQHFEKLESDLLNKVEEKISDIERPLHIARRLVEESVQRVRIAESGNDQVDLAAIQQEVCEAIQHTREHSVRLKPSQRYLQITCLGDLYETNSLIGQENEINPYEPQQYCRSRISSSESSVSSGYIEVTGVCLSPMNPSSSRHINESSTKKLRSSSPKIVFSGDVSGVQCERDGGAECILEETMKAALNVPSARHHAQKVSASPGCLRVSDIKRKRRTYSESDFTALIPKYKQPASAHPLVAELQRRESEPFGKSKHAGEDSVRHMQRAKGLRCLRASETDRRRRTCSESDDILSKCKALTSGQSSVAELITPTSASIRKCKKAGGDSVQLQSENGLGCLRASDTNRKRRTCSESDSTGIILKCLAPTSAQSVVTEVERSASAPTGKCKTAGEGNVHHLQSVKALRCCLRVSYTNRKRRTCSESDSIDIISECNVQSSIDELKRSSNESLGKSRYRAGIGTALSVLSNAINNKYLLNVSTPKQGRFRKESESSSLTTESSERPTSTQSSSLKEHDSESIFSTEFNYSEVTELSQPITLSQDGRKPLIYHGKTTLRKAHAILTDICALDSHYMVLVDEYNACIIVFHETTKQSKEFRWPKLVPTRVCSCNSDSLHVLFRRRKDASTVLMLLAIKTNNGQPENNRTTRINASIVRTINCSCRGKLSCIRSEKSKVNATCFDKHVHIFENNGDEARVVPLDVQLDEWWPNYIAVNQTERFLYVSEIYTESVFCFDTDTGHLQWKRQTPDIEGIIAFGNKVYLAQNRLNQLVSVSAESQEVITKVIENVLFPFALATTSRHDTIYVTQYHKDFHKINRTVKWF